MTNERWCDIISISESRGIGGFDDDPRFGGVFLLPIMVAAVFSDGLLPVGQPSFAFFERLGEGPESVCLCEKHLAVALPFPLVSARR